RYEQFAHRFFRSSNHPHLIRSFPTRRSSDLGGGPLPRVEGHGPRAPRASAGGARQDVPLQPEPPRGGDAAPRAPAGHHPALHALDRKSTRLNSSHVKISYAVFCLKKKNI